MCVNEQDASLHKINNTVGVTRLVNFDGTLRPLSLQLISSLMIRCYEDGKLLSSEKLNPEDNVEVLTGPFAIFVATVETIDAQKSI